MDLIFGFEFDFDRARKWTSSMEGSVVNISLSYVVAIFALKYAMRDRKRFDLKWALVSWNALLAIFSVIGFIRLTPAFIKQFVEKGCLDTYTKLGEPFVSKTAGYWTFLWVLSKIPELVDTVFIVLRKRPLIFMHWYHHSLTLYFSFVAYADGNAFMIWIVWLNFFIHSIMYSYFMLRSLQVHLSPQIAQIITASQIIQFLITHAVMAHLAYLKLTTNGVFDVTLKGFLVGAFMEITYLMLWIKFYRFSYISNGGKKYLDHKRRAKAQ